MYICIFEEIPVGQSLRRLLPCVSCSRLNLCLTYWCWVLCSGIETGSIQDSKSFRLKLGRPLFLGYVLSIRLCPLQHKKMRQVSDGLAAQSRDDSYQDRYIEETLRLLYFIALHVSLVARASVYMSQKRLVMPKTPNPSFFNGSPTIFRDDHDPYFYVYEYSNVSSS